MAIRTALALSDRRSLAGTRPAFLLGQRFTGWMGGGQTDGSWGLCMCRFHTQKSLNWPGGGYYSVPGNSESISFQLCQIFEGTDLVCCGRTADRQFSSTCNFKHTGGKKRTAGKKRDSANLRFKGNHQGFFFFFRNVCLEKKKIGL